MTRRAMSCPSIIALSPNLSVPLVLIKANVCKLLESRLRDDGFNVLNRGRAIYFPSHGWQGRFHIQFGEVCGGVLAE